MALSHATIVRNAATDAVVDRIDLGSGNPTGKINILTSGDVLIVACAFSNPAFGSSVAGTATAAAIAQGVVGVGAGGTAAKFNIVDRDDATILSGSVGASGADLIIANPVFADGDTLDFTSLTYKALAA